MNEDNCFFCSDKITPEQRATMYEEVTTWRPPPGLLAAEKILPTGRRAHGDCVNAPIPGQMPIFGQ